MKILHVLFGATLLLMGCDSGDSTQRSDTTFSAAQLLDSCASRQRAWKDFCSGYLQAAIDATSGACLAKDLKRVDLRNRIVRKLQQVPDLQESDAIDIVGPILRSAYPCN